MKALAACNASASSGERAEHTAQEATKAPIEVDAEPEEDEWQNSQFK